MFFIYSKAVRGGGAIVSSTKSGGSSTATSSSGGGTTATSSSGGGISTTSGHSAPTFFMYTSTHLPNQQYDGHTHALEVTDELNHNHTVTIPNHTHSLTVPNHTHSVSIPAHTHDITLPDHTHDIEHGIFTLDRLPTAVTIKVDGNTVPYTAISGENLDIIPYLAKDSSGMVTRGWHTVSITPNDLGRITAQLTTQFYVQSRGGGSF